MSVSAYTYRIGSPCVTILCYIVSFFTCPVELNGVEGKLDIGLHPIARIARLTFIYGAVFKHADGYALSVVSSVIAHMWTHYQYLFIMCI